MKYAIKIGGYYLNDFIYENNKRSVHLTLKPHYFSESEIDSKIITLLNVIKCKEAEIKKFEVEIKEVKEWERKENE